MAPISHPGDGQTPRARLRLRITLLLLLPALAPTVLWARSGMVGDVWSGARRCHERRVRSDWGRLSLTVISGGGADPMRRLRVRPPGRIGPLPGVRRRFSR